MNQFTLFLDNYKNKNTDYEDLVKILNVSHNDYNKHFNKKSHHESYETWQKKHLMEPSFNIIKEPVFIDASINNINDLLEIIEKYPYDYKKDYNIDVKALHDIKDELKTLKNMIGMDEIKTNIVEQLLYFLQKMHINDENNQDYKHTIIYGSPGTGKTEIAELMGKMYSKIGILENQIFRKVNRSDLVGGYLGQTALKTRDVVKECLGGCLFIDEVYSLGSDDSYSQECVNILNESLSIHKNNLMVIVAGYKEDVEQKFFTMNKGLESRFIWRFTISPYSHEELYQIFQLKIQNIGWTLDETSYNKWFEKNYNEFKYFGRDIENLLSYVKICHSKRIFGNNSTKKCITMEDMDSGMKKFKTNSKRQDKPNFLNEIYI
tara:strand:+ start:709 stop:1839 length:1131 start_codon:yes stop_codon:yes gene_type:complete